MAPEHVAFWQEEVKHLSYAQLAIKIERDQRDLLREAQYPELYAFAEARLPILLEEQELRQNERN